MTSSVWKARISARLVAMSALLSMAVLSTTTPAQAADDAQWPEAYIEIFRLAPGAQEDFVRLIARDDQVSAAAGLPPTQLFFHQDGAEWDVLLLKPERTEELTDKQQAAMDAKRRELQVPTGPAYFTAIRKLIASHTDTKTYGPLSAARWLGRLDSWRAEHPKATK
jgi:hypothetical protein